jgi:hypothetical protein
VLVNSSIFTDAVPYLRLIKLPRTGEAGTVTGDDEIMTGEVPMFYGFELYIFIAFWFPASIVEIHIHIPARFT